MSIVGQTVKNAGAALYADLSGSSFAPGTNILLFNLNVGQGGAGGTRNQNVKSIFSSCCNLLMLCFIYQWRFIPVNSDQNQYKIQSVLTGLYASVGNATAVSDAQTFLRFDSHTMTNLLLNLIGSSSRQQSHRVHLASHGP